MRLFPALTLAGLLLATAGCTGPSDGTVPATATTTSGTTTGISPQDPTRPLPGPPTFLMHDCDQWHTFFPFPMAAFQDGGVFSDPLPEGFTLVPADDAGATTFVFVDAGRCAPDGPGVFGIHLNVQPPAELDQGGDDLDLVTLGGATDSDALLAFLAASNETRWGDAALSYATAPSAPGTWLENVAVDTAGNDYNMDYFVQAAAGQFDLTYRLWHEGPDGRADGHLEWDNSNGTDVGQGQAVFSTLGTDGGPPVEPGLLHRVTGVDVALRWIPVGMPTAMPPQQAV